MEKALPGPVNASNLRSPRRGYSTWRILVVLTTLVLSSQLFLSRSTWSSEETVRLPLHAEAILAKCHALSDTPQPPANFHKRTHSDRHVQGTKPVLLRNAHIWTGNNNGTEVVYGSVLLENGLIKAIRRSSAPSPHDSPPYGDLTVIDVKGAWVTPGIVDVHSHVGDAASPALEGAQDDNSLHGVTQPWLRSLDGLNTHDDSYALSVAGGVTTANVLPGSANAIGGQAFTIKLRSTEARTPTSMLLEAPFQINGSHPTGPPRWRQMKHACGENPSRVYGFTRMDTIWSFRKIYNEARIIKEKQDAYCDSALHNKWKDIGEFPESLQYEALVDVLRGKVKVHTHCYEAVDLDGLIRLTQEFKFPLAAVHHAHEAYLVPGLLKSAYAHPPAIAIFATNGRYKREAYRGSEFAARILTENGLNVVMKSDHPVMVERDLLFEAQQAFYYGLPENKAIGSVTSIAAGVIGMDHRIGYIKEGWDADLVVWDSHPLALGATPKQVFIDGIAQLKDPFIVEKPKTFQQTPRVPNWDEEAKRAVEWEGLPPLTPNKSANGSILFTGVRSVLYPNDEYQKAGETSPNAIGGVALDEVLVANGRIVCHGARTSCLRAAGADAVRTIDLKGGSIQPGFTAYTSTLGLREIDQEFSTGDGIVLDPLAGNLPNILGNSVIRAIDGLSFQGRSALIAYRQGVTTAITAPSSYGFISGLSTAWSTGSEHKLAEGAVVQNVAALHVSLDMGSERPSVSTQIAVLRRLLLGEGKGDLGKAFKDAAEGKLTLVVKAHSADIISSVVLLKREVEKETGKKMKLTILGGAEAHIIAHELERARIGVLLVPFRQFPADWQSRRILPGPPLTERSALQELLHHNVTVGLGVVEDWDARNVPFYTAWAAIESGGMGREKALALGTVNVQRLLGLNVDAVDQDLIAIEGGDLMNMEGKVAAVLSPRRRLVELL